MNIQTILKWAFVSLSPFFFFQSQAQQFSDNVYRNSNNKIYWQNRKPDAAYWQQDVAYKIKATIDEKTNIIEGSEELTYWNNSPDTLTFVYFHLYQNAFVNGSYLQELHKANKNPIKNLGKYGQQGLGTLVSDIQLDGKKLKYELDNTVLKVYLPQHILPGTSVKFTMNFDTYFNQSDFRRRMAMYNVAGFTHYNGVHWYPRICVYDKKKGWDVDQHLNKELYGDFGLFDVELNFASNYVVEATGVLQNPEEVYPGDLRQRLDIKNFANKPWNERPSIITPYDSNQRKTWHYIGYNVHDFAFTADPAYRISESTWNGIQCIGLALEQHASRWQNSGTYVAKIIETFSNDFGMYEYPKMVAADANDGMEYPMLTLDGGGDPDYHGLLMHEIGHNWFYGMIGNNETYRAALDEGFTQFLTAWGLQKVDGEYTSRASDHPSYKEKHKVVQTQRDNSIYNRYMYDAVRGTDKPLNTHSNDFHSALGHENGYSNVYHKTATMLYNLQYVLGDDLFLRAMQHYVAKWKIAHPYFEDFRQSIIEFTHQDLNWFFDQWMETTKSIDYGIVSIKQTHINHEFKIKFKRYGDMQMPIDFRITGKDNQTHDYSIPNTTYYKPFKGTILPKWYGWDLLNPTHTVKLQVPSGIKLVQIDPTNRLADVDMMDNYKSPGTMLAKASRTLKLEDYINNTPDWKKYNAFWRPDIWWNRVDGLKLGLHFDGSYMNFMRKLYCTVWFNSRVLSELLYRSYEGQGWWANASPIDYTVRYENPLKIISKKINWGLESRFIEGYAKHSLYSTISLTPTNSIRIEGTTLYRRGDYTNAYLFFPNEWSSFSDGKKNNTMKNSFVQLQWNHTYNESVGNGLFKFTIRTPFTYNYSYFQGELINHKSWKKLDIHTRGFVRMGMGKNIPYESALYLQGGNPEEMMENKFTRSQGFIPASMSGFHKDDFSNLQTGGGMNLRGYTGYYAIDQQGSTQYINYKGRSGAAVNLEIEFDRYFKFRPKTIRDYLHLDTYVFADAGAISRGTLNSANIPQLNPVYAYSKLRMDAGLGLALTIKKFGPFEKINPFTIRCDFPLLLSAPPAAKPDYFGFRYVIGVSRAF